MKIFATLLCALFLTCLGNAAPYLELGPMLGHVGPDSARIWLKASGAGTASVLVGESADLSDASRHGAAELADAHQFMATVAAEKLAPSTRYFYAISLDGKTVTPRPYPSFTTAPPVGSAGRQRIAFSSCLGRKGSQAAAAWAQMDAGSDADLILLLGDNHYADTTARAPQSAAYFSHRSVPGFRAVTSRVPTYHIWDDHDYGPNDSDSTAGGKEISLATFKDFCPNPSYGEDDNPGIYFTFSRGEIDFFMLDVRYHRSPDKMIDDGTKTMLGRQQLDWLKRRLKASTAKVKIIASGSELQLNSHTDSWTSYPRERAEIASFIENENIEGILLVSGDRHFVGGYQIGGKLIEVTSGPLGSKNFPSKNLPDMFLNQSEGKLYCVFDIDTTKPQPRVVVEVHRAGDGVIQKVDIPWAAVLGEQKMKTLPVESVPKKAPYQKAFETPGGD